MSNSNVAPTIALRGVPEGLAAKPLYRYRRTENGERVAVRTRRGLLKFDRVELSSASSDEACSGVLDEKETRFILGAARRSWPAIERRYGDNAWNRCIELARSGVVHLRCAVDQELELGAIVDWSLTPRWLERRLERTEMREASRHELRQRALAAAEGVADICPELARILRHSPSHTPGLSGVIAVALDPSEGVVNASPRAFSQRHFGSTKANDLVARTLDRLGIPDWVADATGVRRSSRIGIAGRIVVETSSASFSGRAFAGPAILRTDQADLRLSVEDDATALVLVENLQAAETLADSRPTLAIVYVGGMPGRATLDRIKELALQTRRTLIAPDADLGGIRIAEQLLNAAPTGQLIDVGTVAHAPQVRWPTDNGYRRAIELTLAGPARPLAEAVLARGYALEQELLIIKAIDAALSTAG